MATMYYGNCDTHGEGSKFKFCPDRRFRCNPCLNAVPSKLWPMKEVKPVQNATVRTISLVDPLRQQDNTRPCTGHCTSGKRSCDCRCMGKCHGAGRCLGGHA